MIDQFGTEVKPGDTIIWITCRSSKLAKHHINFHKGKVIHTDTQFTYRGNIAETILVERDYETYDHAMPASVLLIDPKFIVINESSRT